MGGHGKAPARRGARVSPRGRCDRRVPRAAFRVLGPRGARGCGLRRAARGRRVRAAVAVRDPGRRHGNDARLGRRAERRGRPQRRRDRGGVGLRRSVARSGRAGGVRAQHRPGEDARRRHDRARPRRRRRARAAAALAGGTPAGDRGGQQPDQRDARRRARRPRGFRGRALGALAQLPASRDRLRFPQPGDGPARAGPEALAPVAAPGRGAAAFLLDGQRRAHGGRSARRRLLVAKRARAGAIRPRGRRARGGRCVAVRRDRAAPGPARAARRVPAARRRRGARAREHDALGRRRRRAARKSVRDPGRGLQGRPGAVLYRARQLRRPAALSLAAPAPRAPAQRRGLGSRRSAHRASASRLAAAGERPGMGERARHQPRARARRPPRRRRGAPERRGVRRDGARRRGAGGREAGDREPRIARARDPRAARPRSPALEDGPPAPRSRRRPVRRAQPRAAELRSLARARERPPCCRHG